MEETEQKEPDGQQARIEELMRENECLRSENAALQKTLGEVRFTDNIPNFSIVDVDKFYQPKSEFWESPLDQWWGRTKRERRKSPWDYIDPNFLSAPWMAAEDNSFIHSYGLPTLPHDKEYEEMEQKVAELKKLVDTLQHQLEGVSEPLAMVADAIKKKAMFTNVAAAYHLLQQMNSIFMGYEPWYKNVRPLESFLMKEKERATSIPSDYNIIPTDEDLADAISSINGEDKALDEYQKWLGVCCLVQSRYDYPRDLKVCCERLANLPYKSKLKYPCRYDNVRKVAAYGFAREDYKQWSTYKPKSAEKKYFDCCYDVGKALEKELGF